MDTRSARVLLGPTFAILVLLPALEAEGASFVKWTAAGRGLDLGAGAGVTEVSAGGDPPVAYAIVDGAGLFRSDDLGGSWTRVASDAPCAADPCAVTASPADGRTAYAAARAPGSGLFETTDGGASWKKIGSKADGMASDDVEWVTVSAEDANLLLVGHRAGRAISVSRDAGRTWSSSDIGAEVKAQLPSILAAERWVVASRAQDGIRWTADGGATWAAGQGTTNYFGERLPVIATGERLFSSSHHGTNKSTDGGRTWSYQMERHARVIGTMGTTLFREDRASLRGRDARELTIAMSDNYANSWQDVTGGLIELVPPALRQYVTIENSVDPFAHVRMATAWCSLPEQRTALLALGKAGLYRGVLMRTARGPLIVRPGATPTSLLEGDAGTPVAVRAMVSSRSGEVARVYADLGALGMGEIDLLDDGKHDDGAAGDRLYAGSFAMPSAVSTGDKAIGVVAVDDSGRIDSTVLSLKVSSPDDRMIVWDGDTFASGLSWVDPAGSFSYIRPQSEVCHNGLVGLEVWCDVAGGQMSGGWNWYGWYPDNAGSNARAYRNLSFWVRAEGEGKRDFDVSLTSSAPKAATGSVSASAYVMPAGADMLDGQWHEVVIPVADLLPGSDPAFSASRIWEMDLKTWAPGPGKFSLFIDEIGFDNRRVRPHSLVVSVPEPRSARPLEGSVAEVTATVDVAAKGTPISPGIYGAAMGDRALANEMGLTMLRAGGNPVTPFNWKTGFSSKGADWFFQNEGTATNPSRTWLATFHRANKEAGLGTYLTIPMMGRVARDGSSVAFDTRKYPGQDTWAGQSQPGDRLPYAGGGTRGGKPFDADPDDTSVAMSAREQTDMLRFMIEDMGYGPARDGGVGIIALDNEPNLWHATHRGMRLKACSFDELWDRTLEYASLYRKIDPGVRIAGGTFWGWTGYFYSGLDSQLVGRGEAGWDAPPDFVAHGRVPLVKWWLTKLKEHQDQTGQRLVDILDFHFYPQTGVYMGGAPNDPKTMEARVQETRVMWDPTYREPSWMGTETDHVLKLIRLMKEWIAECDPGLQLSLGEYNFGGDRDVSGGVAQAELLGVFAREGLDYAFYWFFPAVNGPQYFAYKMFRNPDGLHTAFGDAYLPGTVSAPDDVSVHAARDSATGRLTFVLVNKRAAKPARVALKLSKTVPAQELTAFQYSAADAGAIGRLPSRKVSGDALTVDLPAMSVLRFDLAP
jgi:photosystem II stability/assembly factor-like uncharacterized protein